MKNVDRTRVVQGPYNHPCEAERQGLYEGAPPKGGEPPFVQPTHLPSGPYKG